MAVACRAGAKLNMCSSAETLGISCFSSKEA